MTVGHVYPSDHLVLFPDLLSKRLAQGSCSRAGGHRPHHHSWGSGALLWPSPSSLWSWQTLHSALLSKNGDIYAACGNPGYHSSASWGSPHLVCVTQIMKYFPSRKWDFLPFPSEHDIIAGKKKKKRKKERSSRLCWYSVVNNTYWYRGKPTPTTDPRISGAVSYIAMQAYINHLK